MDMDALVEIQLPTQPIPFYFCRIMKKNKKKIKSKCYEFAMPLTL